MATDRQIEANRRNAQHSTGPKTPEGLAAIRHNSLKHGLTSETLILEGENQADFDELLASLETLYRPANPVEQGFLRALAMATWRLARLYNIEAGLLSTGLDDLAQAIDVSTGEGLHAHRSPGQKLALILHRDAPDPTFSLASPTTKSVSSAPSVTPSAISSASRPGAAGETQKQTQSSLPPIEIKHMPAPEPPRPRVESLTAPLPPESVPLPTAS